jgi:hypothetical protein
MKAVKEKIKHIVSGKRFRIAAGLLAAYLAFAYLAVDPLARRVLPWFAENRLASQLQVERVKFDPLRLILRVDNLRLTRPDGSPLASFERLYVNMEASGLFRWAWRFKDIRLTAPQATLDVAPDGRLNWADLLAKLGEDKQEESSSIARVLIDHILIERGNILYEERNRSTPFRAVLQPLGLELDGLSTLPQDRGEYAIQARLPEQGGTLKWKGDLGLNPLTSSGEVQVESIKLAKLAEIVRTEANPVNIKAGDLATRFNYRFALVKGDTEPFPQVQIENLGLTLDQVAADLASPSGAQSGVALEQLRLQLPALSFSRQAGMQLHFQNLDLALQQFSLTQQGNALFSLNEAAVKGIGFDLSGNRLQIADVLLREGAISTRRGKDGRVDWQQLADVFTSGHTEPALESAMEPEEPSAPVSFAVDRVRLEQWQASHQDEAFLHPLKLAAKEISLEFSVGNPNGGVEIQSLGSQIAGLVLQSALYPQPVASLDLIDLKDGNLSLKDNTFNLSEMVFSGLKAQVLQEAGKPLNWQAVLLPAGKNADATGRSVSSTPDWKFGVGRLALENAAVHIEDRTTRIPAVIDIQNASVELQQVSQDLARSLPVKARLQVKQGGAMEVGGQLALQPMKADLQLKLNDLALKTFSPYVNQAALLKLDAGALRLHGKLALNHAKPMKGQFQGRFSIRQLAISEEDTAVSFLAWKDVSSDTLKLTLAPNRLHIDDLRIVQPAGKFIIHEDGTMNVKRILRPQDVKTQLPAEAASVEDGSDSLQVEIERVSIDSADLEFADLTLRPQFGTHINSLSGVINGLSSDPATTAQVELDGKVDEFGSARIRGSVQPFQATDFTDLKLAFQNLEMNRLTPYSGKFAGRKIDSGKLSVDLEYKIKQRQLAGENKFVINKLKLGERVESADAMSLPLDLAIALLEDSDGLIDLDLPISGSLDDPQFSYGKIIWKAVVNVLTKIVTSPFRALGKLLGADSEKMQDVGFDPGRDELAPQEQEKLKTIAEAMSKRPSLTLNLAPAFDPVVDKAALQDLATRRDVLEEMGIKLQADEQAGPVDLSNPKAQSAVERLLKSRTEGGGSLRAVDAVKDYFRKSKPEDLPIYTEKLEQLKATVVVSDAELLQLAQSRTAKMRDYLVSAAGLDASRVAVTEAAKVNSDGKQVSLRMELGVSAGGKAAITPVDPVQPLPPP